MKSEERMGYLGSRNLLACVRGGSRYGFLGAVVLMAGWVGLPLDAAERVPIGTAVGQMYPDFYLPKLGGGFGRLSDYRGRKVFLVHFASW